MHWNVSIQLVSYAHSYMYSYQHCWYILDYIHT